MTLDVQITGLSWGEDLGRGESAKALRSDR